MFCFNIQFTTHHLLPQDKSRKLLSAAAASKPKPSKGNTWQRSSDQNHSWLFRSLTMIVTLRLALYLNFILLFCQLTWVASVIKPLDMFVFGILYGPSYWLWRSYFSIVIVLLQKLLLEHVKQLL